MTTSNKKRSPQLLQNILHTVASLVAVATLPGSEMGGCS